MLQVNEARRLIDETRQMKDTLDMFMEGSIAPNIERYYNSGRVGKARIEDFDTNIFEPKNLDEGFQKSRTYRNEDGSVIQFDPHFDQDMSRFINKQRRYAELKEPHTLAKNVFTKIIQEGKLNEFTANAYKNLLKDVARPEFSPPSIRSLNTVLGIINKGFLGFNLSPITKQFLTW